MHIERRIVDKALTSRGLSPSQAENMADLGVQAQMPDEEATEIVNISQPQ